MKLGGFSQNSISLASIYTPQLMDVQRVSFQQVSSCIVLLKGTNETTWNKLREIMAKQDKQFVRKQLKGGWLVKIEMQKRVMAEVT